MDINRYAKLVVRLWVENSVRRRSIHGDLHEGLGKCIGSWAHFVQIYTLIIAMMQPVLAILQGVVVANGLLQRENLVKLPPSSSIFWATEVA